MNTLAHIALVGLVACLWVLVVNEITFRQRGKVLNALRLGHSSFWHLHRQFVRVSYYEHLWSLFFFRNPWRLYHPDILDAIGTSKREDA